MTDREKLDEALDAACAEYGLRGDDRFLVASLVERPPHAWPACCGAGCSPCMEDVTLAAEHVLRALGRPID